MLKIKAILFGALLQAGIFLVLLCAIVLTASSFGSIENSGYILALEIASYISVVVASFICARMAWEKGAVYGLIIAVTWILIRLVISLSFSVPVDPVSMPLKSTIMMMVGVCSGALGVSGKKEKFM